MIGCATWKARPKAGLTIGRNVGVLFSYATKRRILDHNPVLHTAKPKLPDNPPEIFTVDELRSLLEAAQRSEPAVLPIVGNWGFRGSPRCRTKAFGLARN